MSKLVKWLREEVTAKETVSPTLCKTYCKAVCYGRQGHHRLVTCVAGATDDPVSTILDVLETDEERPTDLSRALQRQVAITELGAARAVAANGSDGLRAMHYRRRVLTRLGSALFPPAPYPARS